MEKVNYNLMGAVHFQVLKNQQMIHAEATAMEVELAGAGISSKTPLHDRPLLLCGVGSENTLDGSSNPGGTAKSSLHEQYLTLNVDEMHSGHTTEGLSSGTETAKQQNEVTGRQDESGMTGQEHTPHHPFEKKSPFWKILESMDAFKRFPQQPHFQPLLKIKMVCREGVALGRMLLFSAVVEYTSKLLVDDPSDSINDILEALVELEQMRFDVKVLQDRLNRLQVMKLRFAELKNKSNEVKRWEVICGMDVEINDLEEKLREIQAERAKMAAEMAAKASEISILETEANAINGNIQSVEHDFQTLASAAW
ncbi:DUF724 domain-containing protein 7-like [Argentina anserina]|uniref:DUF724 domain-containing protein 7-like n=1 Tax=Argentina anserina TaxID=57926 RepID=UPI0021768F30|nr:DUF724 domain-containing protein 7-like [Potentilla anserina]